MNSKKRRLENSGLYVIIDKKTLKGIPVFTAARKIKDMGAADIVQLRDKVSGRKTVLKNARKLAKLFSGAKTVFIVNDYIDIAKVSGADGVHIGQDDLPMEFVRKLLGKDKIIGVSCHSFKQARQAQKSGADYISVGPIFPTPTKPEYKPVGLTLIKKCKKAIKIPFFAIGGIVSPAKVARVMSAGGQRIVVCRALFKAKEFLLLLKKAKNDAAGIRRK